MVSYARVWIVWACLGLFGPVWACLGLSDSEWACLGLFAPFLIRGRVGGSGPQMLFGSQRTQNNQFEPLGQLWAGSLGLESFPLACLSSALLSRPDFEPFRWCCGVRGSGLGTLTTRVLATSP